MYAHDSFGAATHSTVKSALRLYFEPLLWIRMLVYRVMAELRVWFEIRANKKTIDEDVMAGFKTAQMFAQLEKDIWYKKGISLYALKEYESAMKCFDRALEISPQLPDAWYRKGVILSETGQYAEALVCFDRALSLEPQRPDVLYNKGIVLHSLGKYREAIDNFDQALKLDPNLATKVSRMEEKDVAS